MRRIPETLENQDFLRRAKNYEIRYRNWMPVFISKCPPISRNIPPFPQFLRRLSHYKKAHIDHIPLCQYGVENGVTRFHIHTNIVTLYQTA